VFVESSNVYFLLSVRITSGSRKSFKSRAHGDADRCRYRLEHRKTRSEEVEAGSNHRIAGLLQFLRDALEKP
jgi:hypothetical protein